jgi:hypothetical protein
MAPGSRNLELTHLGSVGPPSGLVYVFERSAPVRSQSAACLPETFHNRHARSYDRSCCRTTVTILATKAQAFSLTRKRSLVNSSIAHQQNCSSEQLFRCCASCQDDLKTISTLSAHTDPRACG